MTVDCLQEQINRGLSYYPNRPSKVRELLFQGAEWAKTYGRTKKAFDTSVAQVIKSRIEGLMTVKAVSRLTLYADQVLKDSLDQRGYFSSTCERLIQRELDQIVWPWAQWVRVVLSSVSVGSAGVLGDYGGFTLSYRVHAEEAVYDVLFDLFHPMEVAP